MPTIAERLETATSDLEAAVETLSTAVDTCTEKADTATTQAGIATTKAGEASDSADAAASAAATAAEDAVADVSAILDGKVTAAEDAEAGAVAAELGATQIAAGDILDFISSRKTEPKLIFDTANNRMANIKLGASAKVGLSDFTVLWKQYVQPSGAIGRGWLAFSDSASVYTTGGSNGSTCPLLLISPGASTIALYCGGTVSGSDAYGIQAAHGGKEVNMALTRSISENLFRVYVEGEKVIEWAGDTAQANGEIADDYLRFGSDYTSVGAARGRSGEYRLLNSCLSDAEILYHAQTNTLLTDARNFAGNAANKIVDTTRNADFTDAGTDWSGSASKVTGAGVLEITATAGQALGLTNANAGVTPTVGKRYRWEFTLSETVSGAWSLLVGGSNEQLLTGFYSNYVGGTRVVIERTITTSGGTSPFYFYCITSGVLKITAVKMYEVGTLSKPKILPGAKVHPDDTGNGNHMLITTSGVTAVGDKPETIVLPGPAMTADGFIHADQVITPTGYELTGFAVKQAGTETSTITVKETSSGGTTVATATLSATQTRVKGTVATPFQADNKKLHLANSSWAGNTVTPYFHFTRSLN